MNKIFFLLHVTNTVKVKGWFLISFLVFLSCFSALRVNQQPCVFVGSEGSFKTHHIHNGEQKNWFEPTRRLE